MKRAVVSPDSSGEDRLIARHFRPLATHPGALKLIDDVAEMSVPPGHDLVLKTDPIISGVHCFPDDPPGAVAKKALRVNLSDLAAKGAMPLGFLLALALPEGIGDAALGLGLRRDPLAAARWGLDEAMRAYLLRRYLIPEPRNVIAEALRCYAHGGMDISDGLAGDLAKMSRASQVTGTVEVARVPLSDAARRVLDAEPALMDSILTGGDDYEVLASVPPHSVGSLVAEGLASGVTVTEIGIMAVGEGKARFLGRDGTELSFVRPSFSHF